MTTLKADPVPVHIRWMVRHDMPTVLAIEADSFDYPWSEDDFLAALRQRNCIGMTAEHMEKVTGYLVYELHERYFELLNFAVAPDCRRALVGTQMVAKLMGKLSPSRRVRIVGNVRETNLPAQLFFRAQGFKAVKVLRGFYDDSGEDAIRMRFRLGQA